ncbi:ComEC/Rec2 family competence protein [Candidatus Kaiserbacteria bacterium]|nr:ComEC/Rec2 family competence protein [Candidatus Kaiserbacteria bacterium]
MNEIGARPVRDVEQERVNEDRPVSNGVRILWGICAGFLVGVFLRSVLPIGDAYAWFFVLLGAVVMLSFGRRNGFSIACGCACFAAALGIVRMDGAILVGDPAFDAKIGQKVELIGIVSAEPDVRDSQVRVAVDVSSLASSTKPVSATVLVVLPAHTTVYYGEKVRVSGTLVLPKSFDAGAAKTAKGGSPDPSRSDGVSGREFNYPGYLAAQGIGYELDFAQLKEGSGFAGRRIIAGAIAIKHLFVSGLQRSLPEPQSGLAGGITVGDKRALGKDLTQEFRTVSLVHIIVLSGYNITIVIAGVFWMFARAPRTMRFGAGVLVAIFFAVMTGFASASLRAALMALIAISGEWSGRIYRPERALALVAAGMVAWNPYLLVYDPGFQLSFLATAGLLAFSPVFEGWFSRVPTKMKLREILTTTSSAQIAVLPLLLYESGNLSIVSLPANLLALVAVSPAMLASLIAALGGLVFGTLAPIVGFPAYVLLSYILGIAHALSSIPFASVQIPAFPAWILLPVYAVLFGYALSRRGSLNETTPT